MSAATKNPKMKQNQQPIRARTLRTPVLPALPERIRQLLNAAYAAYGPAERMSLDQWRDVEQEIKRRINNER